MKYLFSTVLVVLAFSTLSFSQNKSIIETARIKTPEALCEKCKARIEKHFKNYVGVTSVNVNFKRGETIVKFYKERLNIGTVRAIIANAGYDADEEVPTDDMYALLPASCKRQADGGHPNVKRPKPVPASTEQ